MADFRYFFKEPHLMIIIIMKTASFHDVLCTTVNCGCHSSRKKITTQIAVSHRNIKPCRISVRALKTTPMLPINFLIILSIS